ncbi:carbon-nitrogen hydrolase family protein [bacterium]|nr:carbon-nitrogen hydrolase family protein [bacterium]
MYAAAVQLSSTTNFQRNLEHSERLITEAHERGAELVVLPEMFSWFGDQSKAPQHWLQAEEVEDWASNLAEKLGIFLLSGSVLYPTAEHTKSYNRSWLFSPRGKLLTTYDKIHLFDCDVPGAVYKESANIVPGQRLAYADLDQDWRLGLSICYDLRFPELFRDLANAGVNIITLPAAFTEKTGRDHWETLLKARAIENQCYIIAANQSGAPGKGLSRLGCSLIVDPWGRVISQVSTEEGLALAKLELNYLSDVRLHLPALQNKKEIFNLLPEYKIPPKNYTLANNLEDLYQQDQLAAQEGKGIQKVGLRLIPDEFYREDLSGIKVSELAQVAPTIRTLKNITVRGCFVCGNLQELHGQKLGKFFRACYESAKKMSVILPCSIPYICAENTLKALIYNQNEHPETLKEAVTCAQIVAEQNQTAFYAQLYLN